VKEVATYIKKIPALGGGFFYLAAGAAGFCSPGLLASDPVVDDEVLGVDLCSSFIKSFQI
jgi:hypothetical protein